MARPTKPGLEYFPKDVVMYNERKMRRLLAKCGLKGWIVYEFLLCLIYADLGYYIVYDPELDFDVADSIGQSVSEDDVKEIILTCIEVDLFDEKLAKRLNILTSSGIQKRYLKAKRNGVIDVKHVVITEETGVITAITIPNDAESTQSKVKESKGEKSKEKERTFIVNSPVGDAQNLNTLSTGKPPKPPAEKAPPVALPPPSVPELKFNLVHNEKTGTVTCSVLRKMILEFQTSHPGLYKDDMYKDFLMHWSMPNDKGKPKWRIEFDRKNGAFHIGGRLATWSKNDYGKSKTGNGRPSTLRPTSIGAPNYKGTGSDCNVDI